MVHAPSWTKPPPLRTNFYSCPWVVSPPGKISVYAPGWCVRSRVNYQDPTGIRPSGESSEKTPILVFMGGGRRGNHIFRRGGRFYIISAIRGGGEGVGKHSVDNVGLEGGGGGVNYGSQSTLEIT